MGQTSRGEIAVSYKDETIMSVTSVGGDMDHLLKQFINPIYPMLQHINQFMKPTVKWEL